MAPRESTGSNPPSKPSGGADAPDPPPTWPGAYGAPPGYPYPYQFPFYGVPPTQSPPPPYFPTDQAVSRKASASQPSQMPSPPPGFPPFPYPFPYAPPPYGTPVSTAPAPAQAPASAPFGAPVSSEEPGSGSGVEGSQGTSPAMGFYPYPFPLNGYPYGPYLPPYPFPPPPSFGAHEDTGSVPEVSVSEVELNSNSNSNSNSDGSGEGEGQGAGEGSSGDGASQKVQLGEWEVVEVPASEAGSLEEGEDGHAEAAGGAGHTRVVPVVEAPETPKYFSSSNSSESGGDDVSEGLPAEGDFGTETPPKPSITSTDLTPPAQEEPSTQTEAPGEAVAPASGTTASGEESFTVAAEHMVPVEVPTGKSDVEAPHAPPAAKLLGAPTVDTQGAPSTEPAEGKPTEEKPGKAEAQGKVMTVDVTDGSVPETQTALENHALAEGQTQPDVPTAADSQAKTDDQAQTDVQAKTEGEAETDVQAKTDSEAETDGQAKTGGQAKTDGQAKADGEAKTDSQVTGEGRTKEEGSTKGEGQTGLSVEATKPEAPGTPGSPSGSLSPSEAFAKIQAAWKGHEVRAAEPLELLKKIRRLSLAAQDLEGKVAAWEGAGGKLQSSEKLKLSEGAMSLLLALDGIHIPSQLEPVRLQRRELARQLSALQDRIDSLEVLPVTAPAPKASSSAPNKDASPALEAKEAVPDSPPKKDPPAQKASPADKTAPADKRGLPSKVEPTKPDKPSDASGTPAVDKVPPKARGVGQQERGQGSPRARTNTKISSSNSGGSSSSSSNRSKDGGTAGGASRVQGGKAAASTGFPSAIGGVPAGNGGWQLMHIPGVPGSLALVWTGEAEEGNPEAGADASAKPAGKPHTQEKAAAAAGQAKKEHDKEVAPGGPKDTNGAPPESTRANGGAAATGAALGLKKGFLERPTAKTLAGCMAPPSRLPHRDAPLSGLPECSQRAFEAAAEAVVEVLHGENRRLRARLEEQGAELQKVVARVSGLENELRALKGRQSETSKAERGPHYLQYFFQQLQDAEEDREEEEDKGQRQGEEEEAEEGGDGLEVELNEDAIVQLVLDALQARKEERGKPAAWGPPGESKPQSQCQAQLPRKAPQQAQQARQAQQGRQGGQQGQRDALAHQQMAAWLHHPGLHPTPRPQGLSYGHPWVYQQAFKGAAPEPRAAEGRGTPQPTWQYQVGPWGVTAVPVTAGTEGQAGKRGLSMGMGSGPKFVPARGCSGIPGPGKRDTDTALRTPSLGQQRQRKESSGFSSHAAGPRRDGVQVQFMAPGFPYLHSPGSLFVYP